MQPCACRRISLPRSTHHIWILPHPIWVWGIIPGTSGSAGAQKCHSSCSAQVCSSSSSVEMPGLWRSRILICGRVQANQNLLVPTSGWPESHLHTLHIPKHCWNNTASFSPSLAPAKRRFRILEKEILGFHSTQDVPGTSAAFLFHPVRISLGFHLPQPYFL